MSLLNKLFKVGSGGVRSVQNPNGAASKVARASLSIVYYTCKYARISWGFLTHPEALPTLFRRRKIPADKRSLYFYGVFRAGTGIMQPSTAKYLGESKEQITAVATDKK